MNHGFQNGVHYVRKRKNGVPMVELSSLAYQFSTLLATGIKGELSSPVVAPECYPKHEKNYQQHYSRYRLKFKLIGMPSAILPQAVHESCRLPVGVKDPAWLKEVLAYEPDRPEDKRQWMLWCADLVDTGNTLESLLDFCFIQDRLYHGFPTTKILMDCVVDELDTAIMAGLEGFFIQYFRDGDELSLVSDKPISIADQRALIEYPLKCFKLFGAWYG
jgi:hypothetical protein